MHNFILLKAIQMMVATPVLRKVGLLSCLSLQQKRKTSGPSALWNTFSGFSETISSFQLSVVPLGLAAGCSLAALLNLWCSFPAHFRSFHSSEQGSSHLAPISCPGLGSFFLPFILLPVPPWTPDDFCHPLHPKATLWPHRRTFSVTGTEYTSRLCAFSWASPSA